MTQNCLGIVLNITPLNITVKFDHIHQPCPIEMVRSKFLLIKSFHVYRKQFLLILAYAVTIHKCQGLSLDCAIVSFKAQWLVLQTWGTPSLIDTYACVYVHHTLSLNFL